MMAEVSLYSPGLSFPQASNKYLQLFTSETGSVNTFYFRFKTGLTERDNQKSGADI